MKVYNGIAKDYLKIINARKKVVTINSVTKIMNKYKFSSTRKRVIHFWIKAGLKLAATKQCITKNTFIPSYVPANAVTPYRMYKFIWSYHNGDLVKDLCWKTMRKDDKLGVFLPLEFSITLPGQVVKLPGTDKYPTALYDFMSTGFRILLYSYRDYFYKKY